ncbi:hypothetical protein EJB05_03834, partial [Eragrostis curvula]
MESTKEYVDETMQQTTPSPSAGNDGDYRISGLGDDVLVHILGLVADARDVVCTDTLSRRWRGLSGGATRRPASPQGR